MSENLIGYNGKIAYVNLTDQAVDVKDLEPQIAKDYLGGTGLSAKITYDLLSENDYGTLKNNPYSEINPLIFATGPVTGTIRPSSGRYTVTAISPLTGIWGEGTSGGYFPISLRNSGFDAIVITGKSKKPIYLYIHDETIEFKDADDIWGKDVYESQSILKEEINNDKIRVATIGIAGENLVKYAGIINDEGRAIGRSGMGAIMGSKNLKAIAIHGTNRVQIADNTIGKQLLKEEADVNRKDLLKTLVPFLFTLYGTNCYLDMGMALGDTPGYYFTRNEFFADKLTGKTLREEYPVLDYGCAGCTMRCGKTTIVEHEGKEIKVDGPEYESVAAFGPLCGLFDSKKVILSNHKCNVYGFDTISSGVSIAFLIYLIENKLGIEKIKQHLKDIEIEDIKWGNGDVILILLDKIAKREDIGNVLADGVRTMAKEFSVDPELAAHVKGLEMPMHDPRAFAGQALSYMTCYMGAHHTKCDWYGAELLLFKYPKIRVKPGDRISIKGREKGVISLQDLRAIDDSAVNCNFLNPALDHIIKYINAATDFNYNKKTLMLVGERINTLKRLISCKLGTTKEDDKLPKHLLKELKSGKTEGVKLDLEGSLEEYYKIRGWDWETGWPLKEKLEELNIQ
ncbi:MAG: aldehyde ferredoxin oxidoreductase family protein [Candidatus Lokiarchaeota archaeon]|nr:aldehyde ferredoxin oxidoreductase family protein [Candidatus Lokiarchaeota archaeon]